MSKKHKKTSQAGNYALCITVGLIIGVGLGPMIDNIALTVLLGGILGTLAGYLINRNQNNKQARH